MGEEDKINSSYSFGVAVKWNGAHGEGSFLLQAPFCSSFQASIIVRKHLRASDRVDGTGLDG